MLKTLKRLKNNKRITPPEWLIGNTLYLCQMGSVAYGVSTDKSDVDVYGYCMPPNEVLFPHKHGYIYGFDKPPEFDQWGEDHVVDSSSGREYDFSVFSILKYFRLVMECNPNMIDSLFVPRTCVLHSTAISELVRENRHLFLHKGVWQKFKGYAYSQMHKMNIKNPSPESKRYDSIMVHGYDVKFAYHVVRLLSEVEEILTTGDLTLNEKGRREQMKAIRRGEWKIDDIKSWFDSKEKELESVYLNCKVLPHSYKENFPVIKNILMTCLEMWYEDTRKVITDESQSKAEKALLEIKKIIQGIDI